MALFTAAQRDEVAEAIVKLATEGIDSVTINGHTVNKKNIAELLSALKEIDSSLAAQQSHFGMRMTKLVPPGTG